MTNELLRVNDLAADTLWRRTQSVGFARTLQIVPLVALELNRFVLSLPLAIVPEGVAGWRVVVVLGVAPGSNACVGPQGQWLSRHVPAALRGHPFVWQADAGDDGELFLLSEARVLEPTSAPASASLPEVEPLWADAGGLSSQVLRVQSFLRQVEHGVESLSVAAAQLHGAGLLVQWEPDGAVVPAVSPWHRVCESALNALSDADFAALRTSGALALAYGQMLSTGQWPMLRQLAECTAASASLPKPNAIGQVISQKKAFVDPSAFSFLQSLAQARD
jgi:hypothetical protein